jgi:hypothetical protein
MHGGAHGGIGPHRRAILLERGIAAHDPDRDPVRQAHLSGSASVDVAGAAHLGEESRTAHKNRFNVGGCEPIAVQDGADRIDARMGAAAGRVRLDGDALEPPRLPERARPGSGIGRRRREAAGEAAPDVLEDLRRTGEAGPGEKRR